MPTRRTVEPALEPVTLADAKAHLRVSHDSEDALISSFIAAARAACEGLTGRTLVATTFETVAPAFSACMPVGCSPLRAVTQVQYLDAAGALQTLDPSTYVVDVYSSRPAVLLAAGAAWPAVAEGQPAAVRITAVAGYAGVSGDATPVLQGAVPAPLVAWVLLQVGHLYRNREAAAGGGLQPLPFADRLLDPYRLLEF